MIRLLIFDLDGTLVDTSQDITNAINYAIEPFGIRPLSNETIKSMVGSGITKLIESLITTQRNLQDDTSRSLRDKAVNRFLEHYSGHLLDNTVPYPQVKETLLKLTNYKKAVLSNKREIFSKKVLEGVGLYEFFEVILGSDSVPERKPSPVPVFEILKRTNVSKDEAVIIGDSNFDIEAGKAAGVKTIAVTYGYRPKEILKGADIMIDTFGELLTVIPQINKGSN
jgi:phosphoglycolate phosphatase